MSSIDILSTFGYFSMTLIVALSLTDWICSVKPTNTLQKFVAVYYCIRPSEVDIKGLVFNQDVIDFHQRRQMRRLTQWR
jgi:hypothetical protein